MDPDDFPDPEEEFEMRYADEFELMEELDFDEDKAPILPKGHDVKVKKSLNFNDAASVDSSSNSSFADKIPLNDDCARKRQQDEVFGSLSDDDELSGKYANPSKKSRNDDILELTRPRSNTPTNLPIVTRPKKYVFRLVPPEPHISLTSLSGEKFYVRFKSENKQFEDSKAPAFVPGKLLKIPVYELQRQLDIESRSKAKCIDDEKFERRLREIEGDVMEIRKSNGKNKMANSNELWMERYRPKTYLDLLSEETVNRTLLHWLKLWDKVVFNREVKIKAPKVEEASKPKWAIGQGRFDSNKKFEKFNKKNAEGELKEELDSMGRPLQRIVLISGPPGLGKTTLAHVVATHAGYNPVEMNASDDRNVDAFRLQLEAATQMRSVMGSNPRPNCLIIDEIDGAPAASINFLVSALNAQEGSNNKENKSTTKKKKKGPSLVTRPVICICNDLYTPSLRPLRQNALVLQFPTTNPTKLAQRLMGIAKEHLIKADMSTLLALCEKADNDIRSCLATLYFLKSEKKHLRYSDVIKLNVGAKDAHKSLFQVWQEIFHIPRPKRRQYIEAVDRESTLPLAPDVDRPLDANAGNTASAPARFTNVLHAVHSCGEYDRLMQGIFENYPTIKFKDSYMNAVCTGLDWMCYFDLLNHEIQHTQNYSTFGYLPYCFIALHFQFAAVLGQKIKYPTAQLEFNTKTAKSQSIVTTLVQGLKGNVRVNSTQDAIVRDVIPFVLPIITPTLRPVSAQLYSPAEKEVIKRVIDIMISYNLTYRQEKTMDGTYQYILEPDIEQVVTFDTGLPRKNLTYSVKQMLAREIELEKMREYESNWGPITSAKPIKPIEPAAESMKPPAADPKMYSTLKPKAIGQPHKAATDFFGRPLKTPPKKKNADGSVDTGTTDVWYHFKEGYTNAVRRSVKITDFL